MGTGSLILRKLNKWPSISSQRDFRSRSVIRPPFLCNNFKHLSLEQVSSLESNISLEEVKKAIWDCGSDKAPGPDGFSFAFFRSQWDVIKDDLYRTVKFFESTASIDDGCNTSFIMLIPKSESSCSFSEYRPISLINCFCKIIAKILASRLSMVIDSVVGHKQSTFIKGRSILDGPIIVSEIISWQKKPIANP
ncbi:uncharacterized protein LOC112505032 [Cynara cardunculus var. scolymus]|uniref:uncharacterized protein LOC112505032 n=1 Tax=Cynara cardunculus var. scolymus TaxID=59895 RepID=UPI000D62A929|nr:uncharacterized protein LOC112505032 [Cynara cardunculus var. scolymus]